MSKVHPLGSPTPAGSLRRALARRLTELLWPELRQRLADWRIGEAILYGDPARLHVGSQVVLNDALLNVESGHITIEDGAFFGHRVSILTGTHDLTAAAGVERQQAIPQTGRDVVIRAGAWVASNATVLGPVVIGRGACVAAGSVVVRDVPDNTTVGGVPAHPLTQLDADPGSLA